MKPGLSQLDLMAVDQGLLQEALDRASDRQEAYESAIREIEIMIGMDTDEMGFESDGDMLGYAADGLIMHAQAVLDGEGQDDDDGEEESEGMIRLRGQIRQLTEILDQCQDILGRYLPPDGISADQAISELLGVLDNRQTVQIINQIGEGEQ